MNWDAIGAIGEIAGAAGVILSLIYLASQIRTQNTESRQNAVNNLTSQWDSFMGDMATNPELARIWDKGLQDFGALNATERVQFSTHLNRIFKINESMYRQYEIGTITAKQWEAQENSISDVTCCPGVKAWWPTRSHWYTEDFRRYIQAYVDREAPPTMYPPVENEPPPNKPLNSDP